MTVGAARPGPRDRPGVVELSVVAYAVSMVLPAVGADGTNPLPGAFAFLMAFSRAGEDGWFLAGALANVAYAAALVLALSGRHRGAQALGAAALVAALGCLDRFRADLLGQPGWWVWAGSFALLALHGRSPPWLARPAAGPVDRLARAAALALPLATFTSLGALTAAKEVVPATVLAPPWLAAVGTCCLVSFGAALALRPALVRRVAAA